MAGIALAIALLAAGCGASDDGQPDATISIVTTTTILGDVAKNIAGDSGATVQVLLPIGADPHDYQASSQQIADIQAADLVIANGLLLEEGLLDTLDTAAGDGANVLEIGELLDPLPFGLETDDAGDDPHFWLDPERLARAAHIIAEELEKIDTTTDWAGNAEQYATQLTTADEEIEQILSVIPDQQRKLVANHDALGYFATRYDFAIIGTVIPGGSTLADPSSAELSDLVQKIETENVPAIFAETSEPAALAAAVAAEVGNTVIVVDLYTGSLGEPGSEAETLIGMLITNAHLIAGALS